MIRLTDLAGNNTFTMGGKKFEYGKVYSNPFATAFAPQIDEAKKVDVTKLKKGDKLKINMGDGKEEVEVMNNFKAGVGKYDFVSLKRKAGAPYTITLSKLEKILTESEDHEVSMGQNQLDTIIKMATELKSKMGENEKEIPAWIQDHISKAENYISQAASNYHEYGDSNESVINEETPIYKDWDEFVNPHYIIVYLKNGKKIKIQRSRVKGGNSVYHAILKAFNDNNYKITNKVVNGMIDRLGESMVTEKAPCWKGYTQYGMKTKNGKEVPNCIPESVMNEASVAKLQKDYAKITDLIQTHLQKYKSAKNDAEKKKHVEELKKLNTTKKKIEADMDKTISGLYQDAELEESCGCK